VQVAKNWDSLMKRLMQASPQDLVSWIFPDGLYEGELNTELQKDPVIADLMYTVKWKGQQVALHIEFQTRRHGQMDRRVWEYNVLTCVRTGLPVYSVVIYLVKDDSVVEPPYTIQLPTGDIIHHFVFRNIKLWEMPPEVLLRQNLPGLWPLLPLTQGGDRREVVEQMISSLQQVGKKELLALGYALSTLVFEQESDQQWLREIFMSLEDNFEESWFYQEMAQKERSKELRDMLIRFTTLRFPDLVSQAQKQAEQVKSQEQLRTMIDKLVTATTDQEARAALMS
jgi:hypothetical protein